MPDFLPCPSSVTAENRLGNVQILRSLNCWQMKTALRFPIPSLCPGSVPYILFPAFPICNSCLLQHPTLRSLATGYSDLHSTIDHVTSFNSGLDKTRQFSFFLPSILSSRVGCDDGFPLKSFSHRLLPSSCRT